MTENTTPTDDQIAEAAARGRVARVYGPLPAIVTNVGADKQTVSAQVAVNFAHLGEDGITPERYQTKPLDNVPWMFPGSNDHGWTWPIEAGDECLILPCDRDIAKWKREGLTLAQAQAGQGVRPTTFRRHQLSDAVAYPSRTTKDAIPADAFEDGAMVVFFKTLLKIGKAAVEWATTAEKVLARLNALESWASTHIHPTTATISTGPVGVISPPASGPSTTTIDDLKSGKVKIETT